MIFEDFLSKKQAFVFELDNVLYPEKDYLLQVYYLFAQFIEYGEQISGTDIISFMQQEYAVHGAAEIFDKTAAKFNIPLKYKVNFDLLLQNARLPLKLLIFNDVLNTLKEIITGDKQLFLLVDGNPEMQLNKIRQMEWNGLEKHLVVYFLQEIAPKPSAAGLELIMEKHSLKAEQMLFIGTTDIDKECASNANVDFFDADKLLGA